MNLFQLISVVKKLSQKKDFCFKFRIIKMV